MYKHPEVISLRRLVNIRKPHRGGRPLRPSAPFELFSVCLWKEAPPLPFGRAVRLLEDGLIVDRSLKSLEGLLDQSSSQLLFRFSQLPSG